jgi:hypothetical protein
MNNHVDLEKSKSIIRLLITGIDPITKEHFSLDSPYRHPEVVQALITILKNCDIITIETKYKLTSRNVTEKQINNLKAGKAINHGLGWTVELKDELAQKFKNGIQIEELCVSFGRSKGSIISALFNLGLIDSYNINDY